MGGGGLEPKIVENMDKTICLNSKVNGKQPSLQDRVYDVEGCSTAITTSFLPNIAEPKVINPLKGKSDNGRHFEQQVYDAEGIARAVKAGEGSGNIPKVVEPKIRQVGRGFNKGGDHNICPTVTSNSFECNNFVIGSMQKNSYRGSTEGVSPTITAACGMGGGQTPMVGNSYRIRKLTPRECFRLQGVDDADIDTIQSAGISNSQQYKMAGNSITVDVLYHLFRKMFIETENESEQMTLF